MQPTQKAVRLISSVRVSRKMTQSEKNKKINIELPSRSAYILAAVILAINTSFSFILYYTTGITGVHILVSLIDIVMIILLLIKNDNARILVLIRAFFGIVIGGISLLFNWKGVASIEGLIVNLIFFGSLIYILAGKTKRRHLIVGSVCVFLLFFYHAIALFAIVQSRTIT